ncbi:hypothetical protein EAF00_004692 [Botryotinia globosa]|nr:hypothetical protein EAF00_004692 [Botryotinia globosa]
MRPSTYAKVNLEKLRTHFSNTYTATDTHKTNLKEMYIQQGAILLEWSKFVYKKQQHPIPPIYAQLSPEVQSPPSLSHHAQSSPEEQVRQSPPVSQSSLIIFEEPIEETPLYQGQGGKIIERDSLESSTVGDSDNISNEVHNHPLEYKVSGSILIYPNLDKNKKLYKKKIAESQIIDILCREIGKQSIDFEKSLNRRVKEEIVKQSIDFEESLDRRVKEEMVEIVL